VTPLANWISHHAKSDQAPPKTLLAFLRWALRGSEPVLLLSAAASITAGIVEMLSGLVLGLVIDASMASPREALFSENFWMLGAAIAFFLLIRPLAFGASSIMQSYVVAPNVHNLVLSRLHRWVLGHSVSFFDNDFAGRIAQKEMQTARAVTDVVIEILHTVLFALASVLGALAVLGAINLFMGSALLLWILSYVLVIRHFMPLIRARSAGAGRGAGKRDRTSGRHSNQYQNCQAICPCGP
jgi:ATP-binding cassette subfamily B protein